MYQVFDRHTGSNVGKPLKTYRSARNKCDRLDLKYGAIRYGIREVIDND